MTRDELEYAISQYLDGVLPPLERSALEEQLAADAEARAILAEYQNLNSTLKSSMPLPEIAWDEFNTQLRQALCDEPTPVRHFSIASMGWTQRLAIAAGLLFAVSAAVFFLQTGPNPNIATRPDTPPTQSVVLVSGPSAGSTDSPIVQDITIGPAPNLANQLRAPEEIIVRPTIVQIDRANTSRQDNDLY
jgi:anti-sigma factor RsiW